MSTAWHVPEDACTVVADARVVQEQPGIARRRDLRDTGVSYREQRRRLEQGGWTVAIPGVLASGECTPRDLAAAALVRAPAGSALGGRTSAEVWLGREPTLPILVLVASGVVIADDVSATFRQTRVPFDLGYRDGLPVTRPARTAADVAADPTLREADRRALATGLIQRRLTTAQAFAAAAARTPRRARSQVRRVVEEALAGAESGPEAKLWRDIVERARIPVPLLNEPIGDGERRLDGYVRELRAGYEVQSRTYHAGTWLQDTERMAQILVEHGIVLLPLTVTDIDNRPQHALGRLEAFLRNRAHELQVPFPPFVPPPPWRP